MNEALRKAVERALGRMENDDPQGVNYVHQALRNQESEIATHRANYDALVIRLGEVTTRLEAADGLLRHVVLKHTGDDAEGCGMSDNDISAIQSHLKAADHV